jgi:hypothetical protein
VETIFPGRSKLARFAKVVPMIKAGQIHLPADAPWLFDFLEELVSFPDHPSDDRADALSQFLTWAEGHPYVPVAPRRAMGAWKGTSNPWGRPQPPSGLTGAVRYIFSRKR